jgi:hypothetical protein
MTELFHDDMSTRVQEVGVAPSERDVAWKWPAVAVFLADAKRERKSAA